MVLSTFQNSLWPRRILPNFMKKSVSIVNIFDVKMFFQYSSWLGDCKRNCNSFEDCNECEAYCNCRGDCNKCKHDCTCSGSGVIHAGMKQFLHHHNSNTHWEFHERKTKWLQTGLEIDWKYGMTGDEHKACAEVTSNHFQRWRDPERCAR